jgi:F-type H+-transporting ATPase subunit b
MKIDWWTLGLQAINALVLVWLLSRFLFRPVANMLAERQEAAKKVIAEAEAARDAAEAEKAKAERESARLAADRSDALKTATTEAEAQKAKLLSAARAEADKLRDEAKAEIARTRAAEEDATSDKAGRLAVDIAERLLDRLPDDARISGFINGLGEGVSALPDDARDGLGADGTPLQITAAREMTEGELKTCRDTLKQVLSRDVEIEVSVDPGLIAGLELHSHHVAVCNSFKADLERLRADLTRHDQDRN